MKEVRKVIKEVLKFLKKRWYFIIIFVAIVGFLLYRQQISSNASKSKPYEVKIQTLNDELTFSGQVDADEKADLQFQSGGRLAWVGVKEGDYVRKYQAIASLDQRQLKGTLQKYLNTYAKSRLSLDQQKEDTREVVIGGLTYDQRQRVLRTAEQYQNDLNNTVLDVEIQNIALEYANLYSPIEGIVDHMDAKVAGVNISAVAPATFRIVNPNTLFFTADADQTDVVKLYEGQQGEVTFDSYPDETIPAVITSIAFSPTEGETGTVYGVKMDFMNITNANDYKYRLGMTGDVSFVLREIPNVIAIPATYVKSEDGKQYVFKDVRGKKEKIFVKTGDTYNNLTVITSGLKEGDVIYD